MRLCSTRKKTQIPFGNDKQDKTESEGWKARGWDRFG